MTQLQELRKEAKEKGLKGYSTMRASDLQLLLAGKRVPKKLQKNQVSVETQTGFPLCNECGLKALTTHLRFRAAAKARKTVYDGDLEFDEETGELLGCGECYEKRGDRLRLSYEHL